MRTATRTSLAIVAGIWVTLTSCGQPVYAATGPQWTVTNLRPEVSAVEKHWTVNDHSGTVNRSDATPDRVSTRHATRNHHYRNVVRRRAHRGAGHVWVVQPGNTLSQIAGNTGRSVGWLQRRNGIINRDVIRVGERVHW